MNKYKEDKELLKTGVLTKYFKNEFDLHVFDSQIEEYENDIDELEIRIDNSNLNFWKTVDISDLLHTTNIEISVDSDYKICFYCKNWNFEKLRLYQNIKND